MPQFRDSAEKRLARDVLAGDADGHLSALNGRVIEESLQFLVSRAEQRSGQDYLDALVRFLCEALDVTYAFCGRLTDDVTPSVQTAALYGAGAMAPNMRYELVDTPCANVVGKDSCFYDRDIQRLFPNDELLAEMRAESYAGIPLFSSGVVPIGLLVVVDTKPMENPALVQGLLRILGASAASELERSDFETRLMASEARFREFAEIASDWFWETDKNLRFSYFSERTEVLGGFDPAKSIGLTRQEIAAESLDNEKWRNHFADIRMRRPFRNFQYDFRTQAGEVLTASISGKPVFDENGDFNGYRGVGTNITAHKQTERALLDGERRFQDFAEVSSDWFWETDVEHRFTYFSPPNLRITGFAPAGYLGQSRREIVSKTLREGDLKGHLDDLDAHRPFRDFRYAPAPASGDPLFISISGKPIFDAAGAFLGYRGTGTDVTREVLIERERDDERKLLQTVLDNLPFPVSLNDAAGRYLFANRTFYDWYGTTSDSLIGRAAGEVFDLDAGELARREMMEAAVMASGAVQSGEVGKVLVDGSHRHVVVTKFPVRDRDGNVSGFASLSTDITERKNDEIALRDMNQRLVAASRAKSEFLAHMSHELRTPLNSILGFSQIIGEAALGEGRSEKYREYAGDIHVSARHLLELISDILDTAKIEAGEISLEENNIEIREVIDACLRLVAQQLQSKGHRPRIEMPPNMPMLRGDPRLLRQVLINILSNASKFTPHGGAIAVRAAPDAAGGIAIVVSDKGIGMEADDIVRAMEPFGQVRHSPDVSHGGTGLGLPLSKKLVELHGGQLTLQSAAGTGTDVTISFPPARTIHAP